MKAVGIDRFAEQLTRGLASRTSRRSLVSRLGALAVAAPVFPLLPVSRAAAQPPGSIEGKTAFARAAQTSDDTKCDYWRYCAIDGTLCSCCGGGVSTCPPGTEPAPTSWVGSCINPESGKAFLVSYHDCCGTVICPQCYCASSDRETQSYRPQSNDDIVWCFGLESMQYHCSLAVLVGEA
ncbi:MAG TPA: methylamine dehydrogenase light chain [Sphingobium sp.]|uniref:methylamine dehydrogenase light chain n=1 Tax=Sphingobium sp. TaxID=1912891 RepID=UPI002ED1A08A